MSCACKLRAAMSVDEGILDAMPALKSVGRPSVNAAAMWRYFTRSVYQSGDLPWLACREALQNSVDAIRAAVRARQIRAGSGLFAVTWDGETRTLSFEDNGVGMDAETIVSKFLTIGESGKAAAASSDEAAGGFGVAKAVILGVSSTFRWEMHSRDNRAVSEGAGEDVSIFDAPPRQGTKLTLFDVDEEHVTRWDALRRAYVSIEDRLRELLAACDLQDVNLTFNGEAVELLFDRKRGAPVRVEEPWGDGTEAKIKAYRRPDRGGAYFIRLGGLLQFVQPTTGRLTSDVVVDLRTTQRPGSTEYPLNAARDALLGQASSAFWRMKAEVEREAESSVRPQEDEVLAPDEGVGEAGADIGAQLDAVMGDPELLALLAESEGGMVALRQVQMQTPRTSEPVGSRAPAALDLPPEAPGAYERQLAAASGIVLPTGRDGLLRSLNDFAERAPDFAPLVQQTLGIIDTSGPLHEADAAAVMAVVEEALIDEAVRAGRLRRYDLTRDADLEALREILRQHQQANPRAAERVSIGLDLLNANTYELREDDFRFLRELVAEALPEVPVRLVATGAGFDEGGPLVGDLTGLLRAQPAPAAPAKKAPPKPPQNPFAPHGGLRISKLHYDRERARRFKKQAAIWAPALALWGATLRLVAAEGQVTLPFKPGWVLDDKVEALCERLPGRVPVIYLNPDRFKEYQAAHPTRPLALASYLHSLACHELTHLDSGRLHAQGHDERWMIAREELATSTGHLLPVIARLAQQLLTLPETPQQRRVRELEAIVRRAAPALAERVLNALWQRLRAKPPKGVSVAYINGFFLRNQAALLALITEQIQAPLQGPR